MSFLWLLASKRNCYYLMVLGLRYFICITILTTHCWLELHCWYIEVCDSLIGRSLLNGIVYPYLVLQVLKDLFLYE